MEAKFDCKNGSGILRLVQGSFHRMIIYDQQNQLFPLLSALTMD